MSSQPQRPEKRRGERVLIRIPIEIRGVAQNGSPVSETAETAVVSRYGALLRVPSQLKPGSMLDIRHGFSQQEEKFRVVWRADQATDGRWDTGIEALNPGEDFWGIRFPTGPPTP